MRLKIGILALILICLMILSTIIAFAKADENLITTPLDELLPSRENIPSEWYTGGSSNVTLNEPGFLEGKKASYYRIFDDSEMDLDFYVYRFSDINSAQAYYNKIVNDIRAEGGYTEVPIEGVFAVLYDWGTEEDAISLGVISNIVFKVEVYNDYILEDPEDELIYFTNLEKSIVPEFPSFLTVFLIIVTITSLMIIIQREK